MEDIGFSGTGSRFGTRFEAGSPILASQLNALASGVQAGLPMPYVGDGASVSFTAGGAVIAPIQSAAAFDVYSWKPLPVAPDVYSIYPGTLNTLTPTIGGVPLTTIPAPQLTLVYSGGTNGYSYVYLVAECSGYTYPVNAPTIQSFGTQQVASDTYGYLLLFTVYKDPTTGLVSMWQYVKSSLWTDRIKIGTSNPAKYYFGSV